MTRILDYCRQQPPLERRESGGLCRMDTGQSRRAGDLIRKQCCNYMQGSCLLLDCACPQLLTDSICCRWFRYVVLKNDPQLEYELFGLENVKRCSVCGEPFFPKSSRAKYCKACRTQVKNRQAKERMRSMRERDRSVTH